MSSLPFHAAHCGSGVRTGRRTSGAIDRVGRQAGCRRLVAVAALLFAGSGRAGDGTALAPPPPPAPLVLPAADGELMALDDEMRAFFSARVNPYASEHPRLDQIVDAIADADGLHFAYVASITGSARETFHQRRGNCLSFALLMVAVARSYGLTAKFCEVRNYPRWDRFGAIVAEIWHLNVRVWADGAEYELDPAPASERRAAAGAAHPISDARAFANFYNNLGVFRLSEGGAGEAQILFDRALAADPTAAFVWTNKGTALRMAGDLAGAESCLKRALHENPADLSALSCLAFVYDQTGRGKLGAKLERKVARHRLKNPYYLCLLARAEAGRGELRAADRHLHRAIAIKADEPEFYELRAAVAQQLGRTADAQRWTAKLQALRAEETARPVMR